MSLKTKLQITQNSCNTYCLGPKDMSHVGKNEFEKIICLAVSNRFDQCLVVTAYKVKDALSPKYMGDIYSLLVSPNIRTRRSTDTFVVPLYKKEIASKPISYV